MRGWLNTKPDTSRHAPPRDASILNLRYVVLDTELTSLDPRTNRLLSIGALAMQGASIQLGEQFYRVVNPQVSIPAESIVIHQLRPEDVSKGERFASALEQFSRFASHAVLVGHFVDIDLKVLRKEMLAHDLKLDNLAVDTAKIYEWLLKRGPFTEDIHVQLGKTDLASVARAYHLEPGDAHHALTDAFLTARIWQKMIHVLRSNGVQDLRKLLRIAGV